ncbi:MAG TPA: pyridoxal phosphate-dependent aminotransferase [Acetobacteraceae bacterium]|nr:pyridoxal phosphate-dependent aminotransferase [Acetobacteraceae bacterium]
MAFLADRLARVKASPTMAITALATELKAAGRDIISLSVGEPDFDTPDNIKEAAIAAIRAGDTKYTVFDGRMELKEAIAAKFKRENGLDYEPTQVSVSSGGKQVLYNAMVATLSPGDEVIIPAPFWVSYPEMVLLADGNPVPVACPQNYGFKLRPEDLDAAITPKTKWLILNNPNNPSGACCSAAELRAIADVMVKHPHVWIMSDDMYEHLVFDGFTHATIAQVAPELRDRTVTISGASKAYAMTGWRIGFAGGPKNLIRAMVNMQGQATAGVSSVGQAAAAAALDGPQDGVAEQIVAYRNRRDMAVEMLNACRGINCHKPEGAFYVFPNVAGCIDKTTAGGRKLATDQDVCMALLEEAHVATVHGAAYGMSPYLRVSTATDDASLAEGCRRIARFCEALH